MIRLTGSGPEVAKDDRWAELQEVFKRRHCVLFEDFLERRLAARLRQALPRTQAGFDTREHRKPGQVLARELALDRCAPTSVMLFLLLNQPRLFAALGEFAGVGGDEALRYFNGRCYMMRPGTEHFHVWHEDCAYGRQLGLSINLIAGILRRGRVSATRRRRRGIPPHDRPRPVRRRHAVSHRTLPPASRPPGEGIGSQGRLRRLVHQPLRLPRRLADVHEGIGAGTRKAARVSIHSGPRALRIDHLLVGRPVMTVLPARRFRTLTFGTSVRAGGS